jgi:hypothetical protein
MTSPTSSSFAAKGRVALIGFSIIAALFLIYEHTMHVLGVLPYVLLLACPLMHLFMHHGHHDGGHQQDHGVGQGPPGAARNPGTAPDDRDWRGADHA